MDQRGMTSAAPPATPGGMPAMSFDPIEALDRAGAEFRKGNYLKAVGEGLGIRNAPTWEGAKEVAKGMLTPPDPYEAAGRMVEKARGGDYVGAAVEGMGMPGLPNQGMFIGPRSTAWDAQRAAKAMQMQQAGAGPVTIWRQTQTAQMPGKHWMQEISDHDAVLHPEKLPERFSLEEYEIGLRNLHPNAPEDLVKSGAQAAFKMQPVKAVNLEDIMTHRRLYDAMPNMRGMPVIREVDPRYDGGFDLGLQQFSLAKPRPDLSQHLAMLHEIQHGIQDIERWPQGGSPAQFERGGALERYLRAHETPEDGYRRLAGENLAFATEARADLTPRQRADRFPGQDMIPFRDQIIWRP